MATITSTVQTRSVRPAAIVRRHKTLRDTPAMEAGITPHLWSLEDFVGRALDAA
jgi:hypothetical protein